jgi:hypothetical protein
VLVLTYFTEKTHTNVAEFFPDSITNHVYFQWIPTHRHTLSIPPLQKVTDIAVTVALVDNQSDDRPLLTTIEAGGVSKTKQTKKPNKGDELNIITFQLVGVPANTNVINITLHSPNNGESGSIVAAAANFECVPPTK